MAAATVSARNGGPRLTAAPGLTCQSRLWLSLPAMFPEHLHSKWTTFESNKKLATSSFQLLLASGLWSQWQACLACCDITQLCDVIQLCDITQRAWLQCFLL